MSSIQNLFTMHVRARHVRCTDRAAYLLTRDFVLCLPLDDVHPVYETDGAPIQLWNKVLLSTCSSFVQSVMLGRDDFKLSVTKPYGHETRSTGYRNKHLNLYGRV